MIIGWQCRLSTGGAVKKKSAAFTVVTTAL